MIYIDNAEPAMTEPLLRISTSAKMPSFVDERKRTALKMAPLHRHRLKEQCLAV